MIWVLLILSLSSFCDLGIDHFTFSKISLGDYMLMMLVMMEMVLLTGERDQIKQEGKRKEGQMASLC